MNPENQASRPTADTAPIRRPVTLRSLHRAKQAGTPIVMMTAYDAALAAVADQAGVDVLLVGDSLGMVIQGQRDTLSVTLNDMAYHSAMVRRGAPEALIVADMPFLADRTLPHALDAAAQLMQSGGADMVKIEGGKEKADLIRALVCEGIPVCAHVGLLPQQVRRMGGYVVQGRTERDARRLLDDAQALADAGADMLLVECVPGGLGAELTRQLPVPVIGIGAGIKVDGQVLVMHDLLGLNPHPPRFVRNFLAGRDAIGAAFSAYVSAVRTGDFPNDSETFS